MNKVKTLTAQDLKNEIINHKDIILIDVREDIEVAQSKISGSIHIPMNQIPERLEELNKNIKTIVYCKSGIRSDKVCQYLQHNGFNNVYNLLGGIKAWQE
tara:strand:- start:81 stop:380 length:300 start_codon:yes stop_codon:yes gene_type:complete